MDSLPQIPKKLGDYNKGASIVAASGSVITVLASVVTLLVDRLSSISNDNPELLTAFAIITGLAVIGFIAGVVIMSINRVNETEFKNHIENLNQFLIQHCETDSSGNHYVKSNVDHVPITSDSVVEHINYLMKQRVNDVDAGNKDGIADIKVSGKNSIAAEDGVNNESKGNNNK